MAIVCALLLMATFVVFGQTASHPFIRYDDAKYIYENPEVMCGLTLHGIAWAFTTSHVDNWHPLTWLSLQLDAFLFGHEAIGFHRTNVLLHAISAALLFLALFRLTGAVWRSAAVAALFAVHPLHVESVAWIAEVKT